MSATISTTIPDTMPAFSPEEPPAKTLSAMEEPDLAVLTRCAEGDRSAFRELYDRYKSFMYSLAFRFHGNRFDAEDSLQEAFIALFRNIKAFRGQSRFTTWLYRIMINTCISRTRGRRNSEERTDFRVEQAQPAHVPSLSDVVLGEFLEREIVRLPEMYRAVFLLYAAEGLTHGEIADTLNIRTGSSKSYYHRAREILKKKCIAAGIVGEGADT